MTTIEIGRRFRFAFNKSTIKARLDLFGVHLFGLVSLTPRVSTLGITNLCPDGKLVLFGDYDSVFLYRVRKDVLNLQKKFDAGTFVILCSGGEAVDYQGKEYGNYHIVGIAKWKYHELFDALEETAIDRNFVRVPDYFNGRYHVLRIFPKVLGEWKTLKDRPFLKEVIYAKTKRECSYPMHKFLQLYYGVPDMPRRYLPRFDSLKSIQLIGYQTTESNAWNPFRSLMTRKIVQRSHLSSLRKKILNYKSVRKPKLKKMQM
jgi:hypothetical protein